MQHNQWQTKRLTHERKNTKTMITLKLKSNELFLITESLEKLATFHFDKSKSLKQENLVQFHREKFQAIMDLKMEIYEQRHNQ